jgi:hypothetical protein
MPRYLFDPGRPWSTHSPLHHLPHRDRRTHGEIGAPHRVRGSGTGRVPGRVGVRRAQRALRLRVRERDARSVGIRAPPGTARLHGAAGTTGGVAGCAQCEAPHPRRVLPGGRETDAPRAAGRARLRGRLAPVARGGRAARDPHARRPPRGHPGQITPSLREDPAHRSPPARSRGVRVPRARRTRRRRSRACPATRSSAPSSSRPG